MTQDLHDRLCDALRVDVSPDARERRREELLTALATAPDTGLIAALRSRRGSSWGMQRARLARVAGAAGIGLLLVPTAAAARSTVPGDALYPVKKATETLQQLFDEDAPARHRVEELQGLLDREAPDAALGHAVNVASEAVAKTANEDLEDHLESVLEAVEQHRPDAVPAHAGGPGQPASDEAGHPEEPGRPDEAGHPEEPGTPGDDAPGHEANRRRN